MCVTKRNRHRTNICNPKTLNLRPENTVYSIEFWMHLFNRLLFKDQPVPIESVMVDNKLISLTFNFALWNNNRHHIKLDDFAQFQKLSLQTLLHQMTHHWVWNYVDQDSCKGWYHGKAYREKMYEFGILSNIYGNHIAVKAPFLNIIKTHSH